MWLFTHDRSKPWEENQHSIYTFNSVEEFWGLYHNIALPSELPSGCDYSLFKDGIKPMWEDEANKKGGEWRIEIKQHTTENLQKIWERVIFDMITGNMPHCKEAVAGVRLNQK